MVSDIVDDIVEKESGLDCSGTLAFPPRSPIRRRPLSACQTLIPNFVDKLQVDEEDVLEGENLVLSNVFLPYTTEQRVARYNGDPKFQQALKQKRGGSLEEVLWRYETKKRVEKAMTIDLREELQGFVMKFIPKLDETRQERLNRLIQSLNKSATDAELIDFGNVIIDELSGYRIQAQEILQRIHEAISAMNLGGDIKGPGWVQCRASLMEAKDIAVDELLIIAEGLRRISVLLSDRKNAVVFQSKARGMQCNSIVSSGSRLTSASL